MKRRVASLPPLSSEIFAEKVLTAQASSSAEAAKASFERLCTACQKTYYSENAYQNHLGSQKHRLRISVLQNGGGATTDDDRHSVLSSTISLGEPINLALTESIDPEAEAEFSKVVNGIKETKIDDSEPVSSRPSRPHHSAVGELIGNPLSESEQVDSGKSSKEPETISIKVLLNRCLFCNYDSPSIKLSVMHMTKFHGLFIPEQPYLVDLEGLIGYLQEKINVLHECLYCHKLKMSVSGIQTHMRDKGHCMIAFDSEEEMIEVGQFYDFRSSYSNGEDEDEDDEMEDANEAPFGGVKLGSRSWKPLKTVISGSNGDKEMVEGEENAEGWETDSSASSLDSADLTAVPIDHTHAFQRLPHHRHHSLTDPRPHRTVDGFHSHAHSHYAVFHSEYELHLPSGRTAGHRSLSRYYRQNLHKYPTPAERAETRMLQNAAHNSDDEMALDSTNNRGRALTNRANGGTGMLGVTDAKKREIQAVEKRERKREHRARKQFEWGVNKQSNSQKHFRDPLLQ